MKTNTRRGLGKSMGMGYKNLVPKDPFVHSLSRHGVKTYTSPERLAGMKNTIFAKNTLYAKRNPFSLSYEEIDAKPRDFDFSEGYTETWEVPLDLTEEEQQNGDWMPMMNYMYPLPDDFSVPDKWRKKLNNTTIVYLPQEQKYYLALTGG